MRFVVSRAVVDIFGFVALVAIVLLPDALAAQQRRPARPRPSAAPTETTSQTPQNSGASVPTPGVAAQPASDGEVPTEATLGFPIYPSSQYLTSYDAGRGQRYYLFGTNSSFENMVQYYSVLLDERGDTVFDEPPTHIFEIGRFREESMAFPPGVTIKDYTWNGAEGYLNPTLGAEPERFRTIIQIVPAPTGQPRR